MSQFQQKDISLQTLASILPAHFQISTDGSVRDGIKDCGAGLVVLSQDDIVHEWHAPTGTHCRSLQAMKSTHKDAIQWSCTI